MQHDERRIEDVNEIRENLLERTWNQEIIIKASTVVRYHVDI